MLGTQRVPPRLPSKGFSGILQVAAAGGEVIITNDGATILNKMTVTHPAAKMLVELAKSQVGNITAAVPFEFLANLHCGERPVGVQSVMAVDGMTHSMLPLAVYISLWFMPESAIRRCGRRLALSDHQAYSARSGTHGGSMNSSSSSTKGSKPTSSAVPVMTVSTAMTSCFAAALAVRPACLQACQKIAMSP